MNAANPPSVSVLMELIEPERSSSTAISTRLSSVMFPPCCWRLLASPNVLTGTDKFLSTTDGSQAYLTVGGCTGVPAAPLFAA